MRKTHLLLALAASFLATGCYDTYGIYSGAQYEKTLLTFAHNFDSNITPFPFSYDDKG